jgi:putative ABC transport system ATP-binding protein
MDIEKGDFISIIGSNGSGKSTLLNIISGVIKETTGSLFLEEKDITEMPEHIRAKVISRVFQNPALGTCQTLTVRENLSMALNKGDLSNIKHCLRYTTEELHLCVERYFFWTLKITGCGGKVSIWRAKASFILGNG